MLFPFVPVIPIICSRKTEKLEDYGFIIPTLVHPTAYVPEGVSIGYGSVIVVINGTAYNVNVTNGSGNATYYKWLLVGDYDVNASLTVPNYNKIENSTKFIVNNATGSFNINVANITYGGNFTIVVTDAVGVNGELLNGTVVVLINGTAYNVNVTNGTGSIVIGDILPVGDYDVNASLTVPNYNVINNTTSFNVGNATGSFDVSVANITYGKISPITIEPVPLVTLTL